MNNRDYVKTGKLLTFSDSSIEKRKMSNDIWKSQVFCHLLNFYKNFNILDIQAIINTEKNETQARIEDEIAVFIRNVLKKDRKFNIHGFRIAGGVNNDEKIKGLYDISVFHSDWVNDVLPVDFHFECKNLDNSQDLVNKYHHTKIYKKDSNNNEIYDGGVFRYFNGKYAQNFSFGGMIGFVLEGDISKTKSRILLKLNDKFDDSLEGDLLRIVDNSIEGNEFTFDSYHNRFNTEFVLHHLLFNFTRTSNH